MRLKECFRYRAHSIAEAMRYSLPLAICGRSIVIVKTTGENPYMVCRSDPLGSIEMPDIGVRLEIKHGKDGFTGTVGCINIQDGIIKLEQ